MCLFKPVPVEVAGGIKWDFKPALNFLGKFAPNQKANVSIGSYTFKKEKKKEFFPIAKSSID